MIIKRSFSALQRAENFSICESTASTTLGKGFQCSSASRKFLNLDANVDTARAAVFQCSSASRKFLNFAAVFADACDAPFQCSSASRKFLNRTERVDETRTRKFQCSSASRKFLNVTHCGLCKPCLDVSVLFSEPKISQFETVRPVCVDRERFSALQRAENFSIPQVRVGVPARLAFQCSSASRKFLNVCASVNAA